MAISKLSSQNTVLAQKVALMQQEMEELRNGGDDEHEEE